MSGVVVDRLMHLMNTAGQAEYHGESVSQLEHALQTAELASREGGTEEQILAGLLHDLGHVWDEEGERELSSVGVVHHAHVGAKALKKLGFSDAVSDIVAGHVNAKRYLVGTGRCRNTPRGCPRRAWSLCGCRAGRWGQRRPPLSRTNRISQRRYSCESGTTAPRYPGRASPNWTVIGT